MFDNEVNSTEQFINIMSKLINAEDESSHSSAEDEKDIPLYTFWGIDEKEQEEQPPSKKVRKSRQAKERLDPLSSLWFQNYILGEPSNPKQIKKFRRRFGLPHVEFKNIMNMIQDNNWFPNQGKPDATGRPGSPLSLLVLGSLRYMRRYDF